MDIDVPGPEYHDICREEPPLTAIAIGCQENPSSGLILCLLGHLGTLEKTYSNTWHGEILDYQYGRNCSRKWTSWRVDEHPFTVLNCFVVVKDEKDLILDSTEEINDMKKPKRGSSATRRVELNHHNIPKKNEMTRSWGFQFFEHRFCSWSWREKMRLTRSHTIFSPDPNLLKLVSTTKDICCWTNVVEKHCVKVYRWLSLSKDTVMALLNNFRFDLLFSSISYVTRTWNYSINSQIFSLGYM